MENGILHIKPTLLADIFGEDFLSSGQMNLVMYLGFYKIYENIFENTFFFSVAQIMHSMVVIVLDLRQII